MLQVPERLFTFNTQSLALGRVLTGALLLTDVAVRAQSLEAHYTDAGALPRSAYRLEHWDQLWSLHSLSGGVPFQAALMVLTALALLAFTVGWHTRLANAVALVLYLSLCARNPLLRDGQDELGRLLLFFGLFLPLNASRAPTRQVRSLGTAAFSLQVCVMYWASVGHKLQSPWWLTGHAVANASLMRRYQTPFAQWAQQFPTAQQVFTWAALALEIVGPVLLLLCWQHSRIRIAVIGAMVALHLGMWLNIRIGTFPPLCVATWLMFLPSTFWGGLIEAPTWGRLPRWAGWAAIAAVALAAWLNVRTVLGLNSPRWPDLLARAVGLQQWWGVFAPPRSEPLVTDGWFWVEGNTEGGQAITVDVPWFSSSAEPPALLQFQTVRWRHLLANLTTVGWPKGSAQAHTQQQARQALARWMCRRWNQEHPDRRLSQLYFFFFRHELGKGAPVTRELLGSGDEACHEA